MIRLVPRIAPIVVTENAWAKIRDVLGNRKEYVAFLFSAEGGGCNGFNYSLGAIKKDEVDEIIKEKPPIVKNEDIELIIDPPSELLLLGTTIDYVKEDYSKKIYESKFLFKPKKDYATTCGCGTSFSPK